MRNAKVRGSLGTLRNSRVSAIERRLIRQVALDCGDQLVPVLDRGLASNVAEFIESFVVHVLSTYRRVDFLSARWKGDLKQVAKDFELTKERIRKLEAKQRAKPSGRRNSGIG